MITLQQMNMMVKQLAENHGVAPLHVDGRVVTRLATEDGFEIALELPRWSERFRIKARDIAMSDLTMVLDIVNDEIARAAASMRAELFLDWINRSRSLDFLRHMGDESEFSRAERLGVRFAEMADLMFKRAKGAT